LIYLNIIYGRLKSTLSEIVRSSTFQTHAYFRLEILKYHAEHHDGAFRKGRGVRDVDAPSVDDEGDVLRTLYYYTLLYTTYRVYVSIYSYRYCGRVKIIKLVMAPSDRVLYASYTTTSRVGRQTTASFYGYVNESHRRSFTGGLRTTGRALKYYTRRRQNGHAGRRINNNTTLLCIIILLCGYEKRDRTRRFRLRLIYATAKTDRVSKSRETECVYNVHIDILYIVIIKNITVAAAFRETSLDA